MGKTFFNQVATRKINFTCCLHVNVLIICLRSRGRSTVHRKWCGAGATFLAGAEVENKTQAVPAPAPALAQKIQ